MKILEQNELGGIVVVIKQFIMKKTIKNIFTMSMLVFISQGIQANSITGLITTNSDMEEQKVVLDFSTMAGDEVFCQIFDAAGQEIFAEDFKTQNRAVKPFNLKQLPTGEYSFRLSGINKVVMFDVAVEDESIVDIKDQEVIYRPTVVKQDGDIVDFHLLSQGKPVTVKIVDEAGKEIYQKDYSDEVTISKRFSIEDNTSNQFTVMVKVEDEVFYNYLTI